MDNSDSTVRLVCGVFFNFLPLYVFPALVIVGSGCATTSPIPALSPQTLADARAPKYVDEDAVALVDEREVTFSLDSNGTPQTLETTKFSVLILSEAGRQRYGDIASHYSRGLSEIVRFSARVISPSGEITEYELEDAIDMPAYARWILYSTSRQLRMPFSPPPLGSVIETVTTIRRSQMHLFGVGFNLGTSVPSLGAAFRVCLPPTWKVEANVEKQGKPVTFPSKNYVKSELACREWRDDNPSPTEHERMGPGQSHHLNVNARLKTWHDGNELQSGFRSPEELSQWEFVNHYDPMRQVTEKIQKQADEILLDVEDTPKAKAASLYAWVRDNVTYCAIELGMGGWKPYPSTKVQAVRYGDCKDKATYLSALLASQKIDSRPAGIYSHRGYPRKFRLPVLGQFNHAILVVDLPDGPVIIDPTTRTVPFGRLPVSDEGAELLPVSSPGSNLLTSAIAPPEAHKTWLIVTGKMRIDGAIDGDYRYEATGHYAWGFRRRLLETPKGKWAEAVDATMSDLREKTVSNIIVTRAAPTTFESSVVAKGEIVVESSFTSPGQIRILRVSALASSWVPLLKPDRTSPIVLKHRRVQHLQYAVELPRGMTVPNPPSDTILESPFAEYRLSIRVKGTQLTIDRKFTLKKRTIPSSDVTAAVKLFDEIASAENEGIVFKLRPKI